MTVLPPPVLFETHPSRYRHWTLETEGSVASLTLRVDEEGGLRPGYALKLNSYDLGVDIELADAVERLRFEHPEVRCVVLRSGLDRVFSSGANIFMLAASPHGFKVNFCKFTNETRLGIEDASRESGQRYLAALSGATAGGGYELALAADEILLVDDGSSSVSLPEVPLLGVLPGTGGLTRLVDKRRVRRDLADVFSTLAEGVRGRRALDWGLVDGLAPRSRFEERVRERARALAASSAVPAPTVGGMTLEPLDPEETRAGIRYRHVELECDRAARTATLTVSAPDDPQPATAAELRRAGSSLWLLRMARELDDALCRLRFNEPELGVVLLRPGGDPDAVREADRRLGSLSAEWLAREARLRMARTLRRLDQTARSFFAVGEPGACFAGTLAELLLGADRAYLCDDPNRPAGVELTAPNFGAYPMANGRFRLENRFPGAPERVEALRRGRGAAFARAAEDMGLATFAPDDLDWEDELRIAIEERAGFSPDALTGMEASLRFAGPETMETRIFGRLSAWQNWIFQRPNAIGERGALTMYGRPERAAFDWERT